MSRVLLADDSPHAQRMGERILKDEGYEVLSVNDGDTAMARLTEFDPDVLLADAFLPKRSGFDICREIKSNPKWKHVRVVLTAGVLEPLDDNEAALAGSDGLLKKPFEASVVLDTLKPLLDSAKQAREFARIAAAPVSPENPLKMFRPTVAVDEPALEVSEERVRAAVTLAVDAAMPVLVEELTRQVLLALKK